MTTNLTTGSDRSSATIYQFPPRGRYAAGARIAPTPIADRALPQVASSTIGGAWYHDEAIRQDLDHEA